MTRPLQLRNCARLAGIARRLRLNVAALYGKACRGLRDAHYRVKSLRLHVDVNRISIVS